MEEIINQTFPQGTTLTTTERDGGIFYNIDYKSIEKEETVFGLIPKYSFSAGNFDFQVAIDTLKSTLETNGYNFETKIWQ